MKKGFTLIELMGVIIILSLLILIAVPVVDKYIKKTKSEAATAQKDSLIMAAKNWASDYKEDMPGKGQNIRVSLDTLIELGYLDYDINVYSVEVDGDMIDAVKITNENGKYKYDLVQDQIVDNTAPINLTLKLVSSTVNTLTVKAYAEDPETSIIRYEFNIDGQKAEDGNPYWEGETSSKVYTFKKVDEGEHTIMFRVTNAKGLQSESRKYTFSTQEVARLEFIVKDEANDCTSARNIRIIYPAGSKDRGYKMDVAPEFTGVSATTKDITIPASRCNSAITAKATVEGITVTETYNVRFKKADGTICSCTG